MVKMSKMRKIATVEVDEFGNEISSTRKEYFLVLDELSGVEIKCPTFEVATYTYRKNIAAAIFAAANLEAVNKLD